MKYGPIFVKDKEGCLIELRHADESDAAAMLEYLTVTAGETPYLIREPQEITLTLEQEKAFLRAKADSERELMLSAFMDGKYVGNCSLMSIGSYKRYAHRCDVAIALYQKYCGRGIGKRMLETVLKEAERAGYEQAELEVMSSNKAAIALYEKLGFKRYGLFPNNMKYSDGSCDDAFWMMKRL